jgi:hypothetical protein
MGIPPSLPMPVSLFLELMVMVSMPADTFFWVGFELHDVKQITPTIKIYCNNFIFIMINI